MSRVDDIKNSIRKNGIEKKKSRVETIRENSSNGNLNMGVDQKYIDTFIKDAVDFLTTADKEYGGIGWSNASSSYDIRNSTWVDLNSRADTINAWLNNNRNKLDSETYDSFKKTLDDIRIGGSTAVRAYKNLRDEYSRFESEEDYNNHKIGWLNPDAAVNAETVQARKEKYQSNESRIAELEEANKILKQLEERERILRQGYSRAGYGGGYDARTGTYNYGSAIEEKVNSDSTVIALRKQLEKYGGADAIKTELESLKAENNKYKHIHEAEDSHFIPITDEVKQIASKRDFSNASSVDLNEADAVFRDISKYANNPMAYRFDEDGNVYNNYTGELVRPADEYSEAWLNNDTDKFYGSVVPDKLGLFLSASEDDLLEAYNRLSASHGNFTDSWANTLRDGDVNGWKELTEDEITIYYYKLNTEGQASAYKFLEDMTTELTRRETQTRAEEISEAGLLKQIALNVASIPMNVLGGAIAFAEDSANLIRGNEINPYSRAHSWQNDASAIRTDTAMDIDKLTGGIAIPLLDFSVGDAYQALMSGVDSLAGSLLGGTGYGVLMGMGAASAEMKELYERGASTEQMFLGGILAGAAEMVFEKISIDNFVKMGDVKSKKDFIINILKQGGVEASEEAFTEIANTITDAIVMGSQAEVQDLGTFVKNVVNAGLGGFLSGSGMGTVGATANYAQYAQQRTKHGQDIIEEGGVDTLKQLALDMAGVTQKGESKNLTKLAGKVEKNASAKNVGKLSTQMENTITKQNSTDIQKALIEKGLSEKDAKRVAKYLVSTETLTAEQKAEIEGNESIKAVYDELDNPRSAISERGQKLVAARLGTKIEAENSGELSLRNDVDVKERISETGKTTLADTGEEVTIDKSNPIAKVKYVGDERIVYYNTDHGTVEASKVKYANEEEGLLYEAFADMNPAFANAVIKNYDGSVPIQTYINGMREGMILYGMHNFTGNDVAKNTYFAELSEADQAFALKLGKAYAKADAKSANTDLQRAIKNAAEKAKASEGATTSEGTQNKPEKSKVSFEEGAKAGKQHKKIIALAKHLSRAMNINIVFYDAKTTRLESGKNANGFFDEDTDTIYLDLQNAKDDAKTIAFTLSHELVHFIKKWSPKKFNTFSEFLMEQYASHGVSAANLLKRKMVELNTTDADYAYEEMIADACETMLLDSNAMVKLMELRKSDLELFEKIKLHILKILNDIREAYKSLGYQPSSDEAKALLGMKDVLEKFYSLFEEAAVDATKNYQALGTEGYNELVKSSIKNSNEDVFGEASVDMGKTESGVKHQLKAHKAIGEASIAYNERHKKVHKAILQVGIESMYEMAEAMLPYLEEEGILPPDIPGKTIFKNGSYGRTGENTTLCVRTLTYEDFKDRVAEKIGRPLTVSESLLVSQKIYDIATDPQCIYCYVAADRKAYDEYLGEYWKAMDKYIKAMRKGGDSKALYTEYLAGRKDTDAQKKRWSQWEAIAKSGKEYISASDLTTKRKRDDIIAKKNAFSDQIKDAQRYAQSASWAKTVFDYRAYKGDILKMTSNFVDMLNSEYGLRMYSFSDYTPAFIVENMQMIIDASVKGLKSLAYTKDTDYVEIFASTGQAINVSCFAKWDAEKGTYVEDNRQGANWEKTKNLRKQYRNVGAVMVATNDAMVEWALKQEWVDIVIPYHIVKTGTTIANEYQWNNYTSESADRVGNKTANIYPTEHNNDFATYSDLLKERGITPRFSRWYDMVASGELTEEQYMKLVNEVRLPASELSPVIPSFNLEAAKKSFGIDNEGNVIKGGFVDKGGYMGGWYRQGVDVNQEVMAVSEDIEAGKSSLDVDYGMSKAGKERVEQRYKKQVKRIIGQSGTDYGIGVYLNSTKLSTLTADEREAKVKKHIKSLGGKVFTAHDNNGTEVKVRIEKSHKKFTNSRGRRVLVYQHLNNYLKDPVKQEAILLIDELILAARQQPSEPARNSHDWLDNNGKNDWDVWTTYIQDKENTVWKAKLQIANSIYGDKILYEIYPIEKVEGVEKIDANTSTDNKISQDEPIVKKNSENSQKSSNEHQQKKKLSNRTILANALEATAQNDIERNKLAQYKEKIALIEAEEEKLADLNAQIKELSFATGKRDTQKIKNLREEAIKTTNRINTYDRMLLNLESTAALKGVLEREKQMAYKKAEQKGKEALDAYREKMTKTQRELLTRYQESRKKGVESRNKTDMRHKIQKVVGDLKSLLLDPTKDKHVPIGLQKPVAEALDIINMDTVGADERVAKYNALIAKANDPDVIAELTKSRDRIALQGENLSDKLTALKLAYADIKNSDDPLVRDSHNEAIEDLITNTAEMVGSTSIRDMSYEQLEAVYDMYKAILATVRNANKMFKADIQETITENSEAVKSEVMEAGGHRDRVLKATKWLKKFGWNMLKPIYAMKMIGSNTLTKLYENVRKGEDTWARDVNEAKEFFRETSKKHNYDSWDFKKQYSFKDSTDKSFSLSLEQIMSLYAYSKRNQADKHLEIGGFIFDDSIEVIERKGKFGIPLKYEVNDANPYRLKKSDLGEIISILDTDLKEVKGFVDEMQAYLSDVMGAKGNEVSLAMYDIKLYKEKNYFPLKTAKYFREFDPEKNGTPKIKNSGFSKKTVPQAGNPIILSNFMDVWANHVNDMSMYHAFVLPLEDFMRVYNYSSTAGGYDSVQQYIKNAYGSQANSYIETLMNDLNGGARTDPSADVISKGLSLFKKAKVFASLSVVVQQPSAIARAMAYVDAKYFVDKPSSTKHNETWAEVKKYAPVAIIKEMGYFDTNMGRSTVDFITSREYDGIKEKFGAMFTDSDYRDEVLSKAPALADELAWCAIWKAVKRETLHTHPKLQPNSEEFLKAVGERFTEVITKTQVYDSVLSRSAMMRSKDTGMKMATAFMAEPTTSLNMAVDAIIEGKRGNKAFTRKALGSIAASVILNSILVSIVYAMRDDDEDETYTEKYLESLTTELIDGFNPITYVPFFKDFWSIAQGFDIERSDMSLIADLWESIENLFSESKSGFEKVEGIVGDISSIFGLPVANIMRDARGMYNLVTTVTNGVHTTKTGVSDAVVGAVKNSIPLVGRFVKDESKGEKLYDAIVKGDTAHVERLKSGYEDEDSASAAIRKYIGEAHKSGEMSYTEAMNALVNYGDYDSNKAYWKLREWDFDIENGEDAEYSKYGDFYEAVRTGKNIKVVIKEYTDNGVSKETLASQITSYYKPLYKEMSNSERASIKGYLLNAYALLGYDRNKKSKDIDKWLED